MLNRRFVLVAATMAVVSGCATQPVPLDLQQTLARSPELSTLDGLVNKAGLTETLQGAGPFTVFAPTNAAFAKLPPKTLEELSHDKARLTALLNFHVLPGKTLAADVRNSNVKTVGGATVALSKAGDFVTIEDAMVQTADVLATNGVIHTIDTVLIPPRR